MRSKELKKALQYQKNPSKIKGFLEVFKVRSSSVTKFWKSLQFRFQASYGKSKSANVSFGKLSFQPRKTADEM